MPFLRIVMAGFYVWLAYWFTYNLSQGETDAAIITFAWLHAGLKVAFCTLQDRGGGLVALRFALEIGLCAVLCPDIFGWLLTVVVLFYAGAIMLGLDGLSLLFTGRTFTQSRSALGHSRSTGSTGEGSPAGPQDGSRVRPQASDPR